MCKPSLGAELAQHPLFKSGTLGLAHEGGYLSRQMLQQKHDELTRCVGDKHADLTPKERTLLAALAKELGNA